MDSKENEGKRKLVLMYKGIYITQVLGVYSSKGELEKALREYYKVHEKVSGNLSVIEVLENSLPLEELVSEFSITKFLQGRIKEKFLF